MTVNNNNNDNNNLVSIFTLLSPLLWYFGIRSIFGILEFLKKISLLFNFI